MRPGKYPDTLLHGPGQVMVKCTAGKVKVAQFHPGTNQSQSLQLSSRKWVSVGILGEARIKTKTARRGTHDVSASLPSVNEVQPFFDLAPHFGFNLI